MNDLRQLSATLNAEQRQLLIGGLRSLVIAFKANRADYDEQAAGRAATLEPLQGLLESMNRASPATDQECGEVWRRIERFADDS